MGWRAELAVDEMLDGNGKKVRGKQGAAVSDVASADATDLASVITLANEAKVQLNALLAELRAATGHGIIA